MALAFSEACERNKQPILEALEAILPENGAVLEIGSGTGQHAVFFAPRFPNLTWQPSDREPNLPGLRERLCLQGCDNIRSAIELDVLGQWPDSRFDAVFSANTAHIMGWPEVRAMFAGVSARLGPDGVFCLYGPFNRHGMFTSASNEIFDRQLRERDERMGIRDIEDLVSLAARHQMELEQEIALPANNQLLVFRNDRERDPGDTGNE